MSEGPSTTPDSDIYTVLVIVATIITLSGAVFLLVRSQALFGSWNPFVGGV